MYIYLFLFFSSAQSYCHLKIRSLTIKSLKPFQKSKFWLPSYLPINWSRVQRKSGLRFHHNQAVIWKLKHWPERKIFSKGTFWLPSYPPINWSRVQRKSGLTLHAPQPCLHWKIYFIIIDSSNVWRGTGFSYNSNNQSLNFICNKRCPCYNFLLI